ncbi:MAG TPA: hypothetical protein VF081_08145, partial [Solirubrobacterales bacterium]
MGEPGSVSAGKRFEYPIMAIRQKLAASLCASRVGGTPFTRGTGVPFPACGPWRSRWAGSAIIASKLHGVFLDFLLLLPRQAATCCKGSASERSHQRHDRDDQGATGPFGPTGFTGTFFDTFPVRKTETGTCNFTQRCRRRGHPAGSGLATVSMQPLTPNPPYPVSSWRKPKAFETAENASLLPKEARSPAGEFSSYGTSGAVIFAGSMEGSGAEPALIEARGSWAVTAGP